MTHATRASIILAVLFSLAAAPATAQTPATTVKDSDGNVVLQSFTGGGLLAPDQGASSGDIPATGAGIRLMWYPGKSAFRAGEVTGSEWNDANIGDFSVAFGLNTKASAPKAVAMGDGATAKSAGAVAMGTGTTAGNDRTGSLEAATNAVAMGNFTEASGPNSVATGDDATASGRGSVAMGLATTASSEGATATGFVTTAGGFESFAAGTRAAAEGNNAFVWNDGSGYHSIPNTGSNGLSSNTAVSGEPVTGDGTFSVGAQGGVRFITGSGSVTYISGGSTGWSTTSTREAKTNIDRVDPSAVLAAVEAMPISTWEYEGEDGNGQGTRHLGPMAEAFHGALPYDLGGSDDHINSINADGVALGAVKGLAQKVERQQATIDSLERRVRQIDAVKAENAQIKKRLATLEAARGPATAGWTGGVFRLLLAALLGGLLGAGIVAVRR